MALSRSTAWGALVAAAMSSACGSQLAEAAPVAAQTRTCNAGALYSTTGVGRIVTRNLSCRKARAVIRSWDRSGQSVSGPPGWACRVDRSQADQPGPVTGYRCRRNSSVMRFLVGG